MPESKAVAITKSSTVSLGLMIVVCGALLWQATTTATIRTELRALPIMQQDLRQMKQILMVNNGIDMRQDAEIKSIAERLDRHAVRIDAVERR